MTEEVKPSKSSSPCCISHLFSKSASQNPNKIAVVHSIGGARICRESRERVGRGVVDFDEDELLSSQCLSSAPPVYPGDACFTFAEVSAAVDSLSLRVRRVLDGVDGPDSVGTEDHNYGKDGLPRIVGIHIAPSVEYIVAVLSVLRCGEAFLPIDPSWPKQKILSIISSSKVCLIIKCTRSGDQWDEPDWVMDQSGCSILYFSVKGDYREGFVSSSLPWPCQSGKLRNFCYVMYTSGSTGNPKGVCGTEKGILNRFLWMQEILPLSGGDVLLFKTSISFIDHLQEFLSAILACNSLIILPFHEVKLNPFSVVDHLKAYHISRLIAVPSMMRAVIPALNSLHLVQVQKTLKVLVLSGEILSISLWCDLHRLLPQTSILNLYGSTEVSGDCTYFNCKNLHIMLETEVLHSVPIGIPISNCDIYLNSEAEVVDAGEIYVGGDCLSFGYLFEHINASPGYVRLPKENGHGNDDRIEDIGTQLYFRTGDFARRLRTGELVFIGRKDRTVKVMGQRIALEEIEHTLREHPDVSDAAVTSHGDQGDLFLVANVVLRKECSIVDEMHLSEGWVLYLRSWLLDRLPLAIIPRDFIRLESLPMTTTGKIDYTMLSGSRGTLKRLRDHNESKQCCPGHLQLIKEAFCDALMIDEISEDGDFFAAGGNSISAAQVAYKLGIDMKLIYLCPTVAQLLSVLLDRIDAHRKFFSLDVVQKIRSDEYKHQTQTCYALMNIQFHDAGATGRASHGHNGEKVQPSSCPTSKVLKIGPRINRIEKCSTLPNDGLCFSTSYLPPICSFSRCNKVTYGPLLHADDAHSCQYIKVANNKDGELQDLWKVPLKSCVDASPLVVVKDGDFHLFIGAHSHMFLCVDASRGFVRWEVKLEGRIECSAAITGDFSQVVVGCYRGKFYFLDFTSGSVLWVFQTDGEVKSQPVVDDCRDLIWCGTHDQNLYAIDYKKHCCIFRISCGGSVYGSPCIDKTRNMIYVASTSGRVTAISLKALSFSVVWLHESGAPIFGSLCINSGDGNVICCLVDGSVIALDPTGSIVWKVTTGGPIFAGACISSALPSQVLICSRNGSLYSFDLERGGLLWEYQTGDPITSSAYVDEQIQLMSDASDKPDRLACICTSSGSIHVIRISPSIGKARDGETECPMVSRYACLDLQGGIFSSPVMICGRIFVGCRDDYVHCINVVK